MLGTPRSEPGQSRVRSERISGAVVFEGYTHPETWDPEVDGEIYPGKGEPPPWFFEEKGKKGGKKGEEKAKGKTRAGGEGARGSRTPCHAQISRSRRSRTLEGEMMESHLEEEIKEAEEQKEEESRSK